MERYEIIIQDRRTKKPTNVSGEDEKKKTNVSGQDETDKEDKEKENKISAKLIAKTAINEARTLIVANLGELKRDTLYQAKIEDAMDLADTLISFKVHPAYGALTLANKMTNKIINLSVQNQRETSRLEVSLQRASYVNRSRE